MRDFFPVRPAPALNHGCGLLSMRINALRVEFHGCTESTREEEAFFFEKKNQKTFV
jgi:hypothetical protein